MNVALNLLYMLPGVVGGTETYAEGLIAGFANLGGADTFTVIVNRESEQWPLPAVPHVRRHVCPVDAASRSARYLYEQVRLPGVLRAIGADVVHSPGYVGPLFPGCPSVVTIPDLNFRTFGASMPVPRRIALEVFVRACARAAERVIAISNFGRSELVGGLGVAADKVRVTPLAARPQLIGASDGDSEILSRYDIQPPFALAYGSTSPNKNIGTLLRAWREARRGKGMPGMLVIAGHLPRGLSDEPTYRELDRVGVLRVTGYLPRRDAEAVLRCARFLVFPSVYEGFGLPVLEAMQAGVPVICSNRASLPEVGGEAALYVDPFDVEGFVDRMRTVMTDDVVWADRRRMALENVRRFSWNRTATLTREVYGEAVSAASC